jgi:hypothetical protein
LIGLTPEGAAYFHRHHFYPILRYVQKLGNHLPGDEKTLTLSPDRDLPVYIYGRHSGKRLDKSMVHLLGSIGVFQYNIGFSESGFYIPFIDFYLIGNITGPVIFTGLGIGDNIGI